MSYTDILDRLDSVTAHLNHGTKTINSLATFFRSVRIAGDRYSSRLVKSIDVLNKDLAQPQHMDTLSASLMTLTEYFMSAANEYANLGASIQTNVTNVLENCSQAFVKTNLAYVANAVELNSRLAKTRQVFQSSKKKYMNEANKQENSKKIQSAKEEYQRSFEELNAMYDERESGLRTIFQILQASEENRITTIQNSIEKYTFFYQYHLGLILNMDGVTPSIKNINPKLDIRVFVDVNKKPSPLREQMISFKEWRIQQMTPSQATITVYLNSIFNDSQCSYKISEVSKALQSPQMRVLFIDILDSFKHIDCLTEVSLHRIAEGLHNLLSYIHPSKDHYVLCKILMLSQSYYSFSEQNRLYLSSLIRTHYIWNNQTLWKSAIETSINLKIDSERECEKRAQMNRRRSFASLFKSLTIDSSADDRTQKSATQSVISQYIHFMSLMDVPLSTSSETITKIATKCDLESQKVIKLLTELHISTHKPLRRTTSKRVQRWGSVLSGAFRYLSHWDLLSVLCVSKAWYRFSKPHCVRNVLQQNNPILRPKCWEYFLAKNSPIIKFKPRLISKYSEIINMDVDRSYKLRGQLSPDTLKKLLNNFARQLGDTGYFQGMNYLAGTLLIQLRDEQLTLQSLLGLLDRYGMKEVFQKDLNKLKQFFYQLDRLIALYLPEVSASLVAVGINAGHFASPWFITIFAGTLSERQSLLLSVWDGFISKGWKVVFHMAVVLINCVSVSLVGGSFEEIMAGIGSIGGLQEEEIREQAGRFCVTNRVLDALEEEYRSLVDMANKGKQYVQES